MQGFQIINEPCAQAVHLFGVWPGILAWNSILVENSASAPNPKQMRFVAVQPLLEGCRIYLIACG